MERLCRVKRARSDDFRHDRALPFPRGFCFRADFLRGFFLCFIVEENRGSILGAHIVSLAIQRGGIMHLEEKPKEILIRDP